MGKRSAIYIPYPQAIPCVPIIDPVTCLRYSGADCRECADACPSSSIDFCQEDSVITERFGAIVVATGATISNPYEGLEHELGGLPDVITSLQLERLLSSAGPTLGEVYRPSDGLRPATVAFVCPAVLGKSGSGRSVCSSVCCMNMVKQAALVKRVCGRSEVYVIHGDLRITGRGGDELVSMAREEQEVHFVRGRVTGVQVAGARLVVLGEHLDGAGRIDIATDLLVLATGMEGNPDAEEVAEMFGLICDEHGFLVQGDLKLRPVESTARGIFLAGTVTGPRDIADCVTQGGAAAVAVIGLFQRLASMVDTKPVHLV